MGLKKGIIMDIGNTVVDNLDVNYRRGFLALWRLNQNHAETGFVAYATKYMNAIIKKRDIYEFRFLDLLKTLIQVFHLKFTLSLDALELKFVQAAFKMQKTDDISLFLSYLKDKGYAIVGISNTCYSKHTILKIIGADRKYFSAILTSSAYLLRKPNLKFLQLALDCLGCAKEDVFYIGDQMRDDIAGAARFGLKTIWLNPSGKKFDAKIGVNPDYNVKSYLEVIERGIL